MISEREGLELEKIWVIHKSGFTLGTLVDDSPKKNTQYTSYSLVKSQVCTDQCTQLHGKLSIGAFLIVHLCVLAGSGKLVYDV